MLWLGLVWFVRGAGTSAIIAGIALLGYLRKQAVEGEAAEGVVVT